MWSLKYDRICQHLEDHSSDDQCMLLQNYAWVKIPFKVQIRPMDFHVAEHEKFIDISQFPHCS